MTGCFPQEQEQGDLRFFGESKGQLENWYYLSKLIQAPC